MYIYIGIYLYTHHTRWYVCIYIFIHTHTHTHTGAHADAGIRNCMLDLPLYQFNPSEQRKPVEEWTEDQVSVWLGQVALVFFLSKKRRLFFQEGARGRSFLWLGKVGKFTFSLFFSFKNELRKLASVCDMDRLREGDWRS